MIRSWQIPRRTFLKGLGTAIGLPALECMFTPARLLAADSADKPPVRAAFIYIPNGANMTEWTPTAEGADFDLPPILQALQNVRPELSILSGLAHDKARPNGDGAGDHARACATFLTGCQARKTPGADIRVGVSVDQLAAQKLGRFTRFPSLELGCDRAQLAGNCDSGYSCAYSYNIAWKTESTPLPPEVDPRLIFERLFASENSEDKAENQAWRRRYQKSILDFVMEDASQLKKRLGIADQRKLDEYLTAVRELEVRIERAEKTALTLPNYTKPTGIPKDDAQHIRLIYDLLAIAFQTDSTRVASFVTAHDGSNKPYPFIGVSEGHHDLSHHGNDEEKKKKIGLINRYHIAQFAYFLDKLKGIREGEGTLLDNCMIVYGSGIADGNSHAHHDLPVLLAGRGGGAMQSGCHVRYPKDTPMANLFLTMLKVLDCDVPRIGDSTGTLNQITTAAG